LTAPLVAVFGSSQAVPGSEEWAAGVLTGRRLARAGYGVITGGYGGTMESVSEGTSVAGGPVVGVIAPVLFPGRFGANSHVTEIVEAPGLTARIGTMLDRSLAAIALPGSIGTAAELFIAWNSNHIVRRNGGRHYPVSAVGESWRKVGAMVAEEIGALLEDVHWATGPDEAVDWVLEQLGPGS
jgi:uncharacterized protein (TIGR00725 family)